MELTVRKSEMVHRGLKPKSLTGEKVDTGIGLWSTLVNVLESTLEWKNGEVIVRSGIGSHTRCFSKESASLLCTSHSTV